MTKDIAAEMSPIEKKIFEALRLLEEAITEDAQFDVNSPFPSVLTRICDNKICVNRIDRVSNITIQKRGTKFDTEFRSGKEPIVYEFTSSTLKVLVHKK